MCQNWTSPIVLEVKGMSCPHCAAAIEKSLSQIKGISQIKADAVAGKVYFNAPADIDLTLIKEAICELGFEA